MKLYEETRLPSQKPLANKFSTTYLFNNHNLHQISKNKLCFNRENCWWLPICSHVWPHSIDYIWMLTLFYYVLNIHHIENTFFCMGKHLAFYKIVKKFYTIFKTIKKIPNVDALNGCRKMKNKIPTWYMLCVRPHIFNFINQEPNEYLIFMICFQNAHLTQDWVSEKECKRWITHESKNNAWLCHGWFQQLVDVWLPLIIWDIISINQRLMTQGFDAYSLSARIASRILILTILNAKLKIS